MTTLRGAYTVGVRESAVYENGAWWRALDGEPVEGPFTSSAEVTQLIRLLEHRRTGCAEHQS
jgi:hypothetical protein